MSPKRRIHLLTMSKIPSHPVVVAVVVVLVVVVVVVVAAEIFSSRKCSSHFLE